MSAAAVDETSGRNSIGPRLQSPDNTLDCKDEIIKGIPRSNFLHIPLRLTAMLGILPKSLFSPGNQFFKLCYNTHSNFCFWLFLAFLTTSYVQLVIIITRPELDVEELWKNLLITPIFTVTVIRLRAIKSPKFTWLIEYILKNEQRESNIAYPEVTENIKSSTKMVNCNILIYLGMMVMTEISYTIRPLLEPPMEVQKGNCTILVPSMPLAAWFPFDKDQHFVGAYILNSINVVFCSTYDTFAEILIISVLVYPTIQLRILQHRLENFEGYLSQNEFASREVTPAGAMKQCIKLHREIIEYVAEFNDIMGLCMFLDFVQSSVHLACILVEMLEENVTLIQFISVAAYLIIMNFRLFIHYYYANEVTALSEGVALAVHQSQWYRQPRPVKFMTFMVIMRSQKPLRYKLDMFGYMSLRTYLSILNAAYSYIMLMHRIN